jgi:hypothetical protein
MSKIKEILMGRITKKWVLLFLTMQALSSKAMIKEAPAPQIIPPEYEIANGLAGMRGISSELVKHIAKNSPTITGAKEKIRAIVGLNSNFYRIINQSSFGVTRNLMKDSFDIKNGLLGAGRDTYFLLQRLFARRYSKIETVDLRIRNVIAMCKETFLWMKHPYFVYANDTLVNWKALGNTVTCRAKTLRRFSC